MVGTRYPYNIYVFLYFSPLHTVYRGYRNNIISYNVRDRAESMLSPRRLVHYTYLFIYLMVRKLKIYRGRYLGTPGVILARPVAPRWEHFSAHF